MAGWPRTARPGIRYGCRRSSRRRSQRVQSRGPARRSNGSLKRVSTTWESARASLLNSPSRKHGDRAVHLQVLDVHRMPFVGGQERGGIPLGDVGRPASFGPSDRIGNSTPALEVATAEPREASSIRRRVTLARPVGSRSDGPALIVGRSQRHGALRVVHRREESSWPTCRDRTPCRQGRCQATVPSLASRDPTGRHHRRELPTTLATVAFAVTGSPSTAAPAMGARTTLRPTSRR